MAVKVLSQHNRGSRDPVLPPLRAMQRLQTTPTKGGRGFIRQLTIQSTPLIKDTLVPAPRSFIEGVSSTEGFWSSSSYMPLYHHLGTSEAELILSEGMRLCIC